MNGPTGGSTARRRPREVAASRQAKRLLEAARSPLWGNMNAAGRHVVDETLRELCLFDEHSWGSSKSVAFPYDLDSQGQATEKACLAYRPMARAQWLLGQRVRSRLAAEGEGLYLANTAPLAWSGWVRMPANALREDYRSLDDPRSGDKRRLYFDNGVRYAWPQNLGEFSPRGHRRRLCRQRSAAGGQVLGGRAAGPDGPQAASEHPRHGRRFTAGNGANRGRGRPRLADHRHLARHDSAVISAGDGRFFGRAHQRPLAPLAGQADAQCQRRQAGQAPRGVA